MGVATTYNFSKFFCEICQENFPKTVVLKSKKEVNMLLFEKPDKPYLIM